MGASVTSVSAISFVSPRRKRARNTTSFADSLDNSDFSAAISGARSSATTRSVSV